MQQALPVSESIQLYLTGSDSVLQEFQQFASNFQPVADNVQSVQSVAASVMPVAASVTPVPASIMPDAASVQSDPSNVHLVKNKEEESACLVSVAGDQIKARFASIDIRLKQAEQARVKLTTASNEKVAILKFQCFLATIFLC